MRDLLMKTSFLMILLPLMVACAGASNPLHEDAGTEDAGTEDAGTEDAEDAGTEDAGTEDAGTEDAGTEDAGTDAEDAGTEDGGDGGALAPDPGEPGVFSVASSPHELDLGDDVLSLSLFIPEAPGTYPVIVFHHGFQLETGLYTSYGEHLASWGYVVVLPQMPGSLWSSPSHRELKELLLQVLDWIDAEASNASGPLQGKVDSTRLALAGHSMGGKISLLLATEDIRPLGVFGVDPVDSGSPLSNDPVEYPSVTPELMSQLTVPCIFLGETVNATCEGWLCQACAPEDQNFQQYFTHASGPAMQIEVIGANHVSFLDNPNCGITCNACDPGSDDPTVTRRLTQRSMTAFFNVLLRDESEYLPYLLGAPMQESVQAGLLLVESKNGFL